MSDLPTELPKPKLFYSFLSGLPSGIIALISVFTAQEVNNQILNTSPLKAWVERGEMYPEAVIVHVLIFVTLLGFIQWSPLRKFVSFKRCWLWNIATAIPFSLLCIVHWSWPETGHIAYVGMMIGQYCALRGRIQEVDKWLTIAALAAVLSLVVIWISLFIFLLTTIG